MSQLRQGHRCQIDCTNHEEVITGLELKSKDLYYFWRNYEWLYARYEQSLLQTPPEPMKPPEVIKEIVQVKESHDKCNKEIEELESANERLTKENKKLRVELEGYKKQATELENNNRYEIEYKKKITTLENKNTEIQAISQKQLSEITKLKNALRAAEDDAEAERARLAKENKRLTQTIIELQQTIDEFRSKPAQTIPQAVSKQEGPSLLQIEEFKSKQVTLISSKLRTLSEQAQRLVSEECESMRREFEGRLQEVLQSLSQRQLTSIVQVLEEE